VITRCCSARGQRACWPFEPIWARLAGLSGFGPSHRPGALLYPWLSTGRLHCPPGRRDPSPPSTTMTGTQSLIRTSHGGPSTGDRVQLDAGRTSGPATTPPGHPPPSPYGRPRSDTPDTKDSKSCPDLALERRHRRHCSRDLLTLTTPARPVVPNERVPAL